VSTHLPSSDPDETVIRSRAPEPPAEPPNRRPHPTPPKRLIAVVVGAVAVVIALYVAGYLLVGDNLPKAATISGVAVGGLDPEEAVGRLTAELGGRATQPIAVTAGEKAAEVDPVAAGLTIDYQASVAAAGGGRSLNPAHLVTVLTGGGRTEAVVEVDQVLLSAAIKDLAGRIDQKPVGATLAYAGTRVKRTTAETGLVLRTAAAETAVRNAFLTDDGPVPLPADRAEPGITDDEAIQVARAYAKPAVSGPVRVAAGAAGSFRVTPKDIAGAVSFVDREGTLTPDLDATKLRRNAAAAVKTVELAEPKDATVRLVKGKPKVVPAVDGTTVTADALKKAVEPALTKSGRARVVDVELTGANAKFSTTDARNLGIKRVTGKFTTYFPYLEYRNVNIGRAAELINGTVLKPGETFSLNKTVGERTRANGFTEGFIIKGGKFKKELGGGVSQSATTTYNAMFFAGLKDIQHQPHTLYIDRYPPGREATVAWPSLDLKFQNDTKYGVLVQAYLVKAGPGKQGSLTVKMWSSKTYDKITSTTPKKSNFTTGRDLEDDSASCEPMVPVPGFDADYQRLFYRDGKVVKRQNFHWRYAPTDRVRCT
jgi:vancomycin resistance protein YoaR